MNVLLVGQPTCTVRVRDVCSAVQELGALGIVNVTAVEPYMYTK